MRSSTHLLCTMCAALLAALLARPAAAQPGRGQPANHTPGPAAPAQAPAKDKEAERRARELFLRGDRLYQQGRYEEALEAFEESYRLSQRPLILYAMANTYERLGRYEEALAALRRYAPGAKVEEEDNIRERIRSLERRAEKKQRGEQTTAAQPPPEPQPQPIAPPPEPAARAERSRPLAGWIVAGAGVALLGTGAVTGLVARNAKNEIGERCGSAGNTPVCLSEVDALVDRNRLFSRIADVNFAIGTAALATGVLILVLGGDGETSTRAHVAMPRPGTLEVGIVGRF